MNYVPLRIINHPTVAAIMAAFPGSEIIMHSTPPPELPQHFEKKAILAASEPAGIYIEQLGKTDMATWTEDEWHGFLEVVILSAREHLEPPLSEIPY